jgi:Flp pilus assembly protein TadB
MTRGLVFAGLILWTGSTLVLSQLRWFSRARLSDRLRPYAFGISSGRGRAGLLSMESFRDAVGPLAEVVGERVARLMGISEDLTVRLARIHSTLDPAAFRLRQIGAALAGFAGGGLAAIALHPPLPVALLFLLGAPVLGFLVVEQRLAAASRAWQRRLFLELPVVTEQLATLLSAGYSLTSAVSRVATRGHGACARDLARVVARIRQGLTETEALSEWAELARVPAVDRLLPVLALNREASDLGRLLSGEARAIRRDVQRQLTETVERREQQVWIPVTVATLLPGVVFLAVPFIAALQVFAD